MFFSSMIVLPNMTDYQNDPVLRAVNGVAEFDRYARSNCRRKLDCGEEIPVDCYDRRSFLSGADSRERGSQSSIANQSDVAGGSRYTGYRCIVLHRKVASDAED